VGHRRVSRGNYFFPTQRLLTRVFPNGERLLRLDISDIASPVRRGDMRERATGNEITRELPRKKAHFNDIPESISRCESKVLTKFRFSSLRTCDCEGISFPVILFYISCRG